MRVLKLEKDLRRPILRGHPWIYDRALRSSPRNLRAGEVVGIADARGELAIGFADPTSPIRVRVVSTDPARRPDAGWARRRAARAARLRREHPSLVGVEALRLVHGEADGMPGLVVDLYRDTGVAVFDGAGARAFWEPRVRDLLGGFRDGGLPLARLFARGVGVLRGEEPAPEIEFAEGGARFVADVRRGHKTGWFLDQRDNRALIRSLAGGKDVLDLFAYSGGFAVQAALGGARKVTAVDAAAPAIAAARRHFERNGLRAEDHDLRVADVFAFLEESAARGRRFDLVICDPPSFAPSERTRARALAAYRRLNAAALRVLAGGGLLGTATCSSHVSELDFFEVVAEAAARVGRTLRVLGSRGAAPDHPLIPAFPEGRYLTFLLACAD